MADWLVSLQMSEKALDECLRVEISLDAAGAGEEEDSAGQGSDMTLSELSADSQQFFDVWSAILRAPVEAANLALRIHHSGSFANENLQE